MKTQQKFINEFMQGLGDVAWWFGICLAYTSPPALQKINKIIITCKNILKCKRTFEKRIQENKKVLELFPDFPPNQAYTVQYSQN